jgi:hypothetical protein
MRKLHVGDSVVYFDPVGKPHPALVTAVWGSGEGAVTEGNEPSINVVFVDPNDCKTDSYGRQTSRETSLVHKARQAAHGRFWKFSDEP